MTHSGQSGYAENRARATTVTNTNRHLSSKRGQAVRAAPTRMVGSSKKAPQINNTASNSDRADGFHLPNWTCFDPTHAACIHALPLQCLCDHRPRQQEQSDFLRSRRLAQYHWLQISKLFSNSRVWTRMFKLEMTISCLMYDWSVNLYISSTLWSVPRNE